jgi:hypothetical protein
MPIRARRRLDCCELEDRVLLSATPLGGETLVNTTTADVQNLDPETTAAAADADGNLVIVWTSANQDGSGDGVFGQRRDDAGNQLGSEFQINTMTAGDQRHAATARDPAGNFVVVWESDGQDGSGWGIFGQRFDAAGNAVGGEFQINTTTSGDQRGASVAIDAAGNFVVTWSSDGQDGSGWGVYGRRFDAAGTALGSEFLVNTYTTGNQQQASVAANADGQFATVWTSDGQDGSSGGVYLRRYDSDGTALAAPTRVNQTTSGDQTGASVSINADGDVLVAWQSFGQDLILVGDYGVYARRYDSSGAAVGGEFQVNTYTLLAQAEPTALLRDDGRFYVAWTSFGQDFLVLGTDGVYLQSYAADGSTDGTETLINSTIFGDQAAPTLVGQTPNNLAIVWSGEGAGDTAGIFLQRLVDGANTAPVNTVPGAQTTAYETALVLANATSNAPSLADATAGGATMQMILSVTNGTLTLPGTTGLTFLVGDGTDESAMTFRGNISAINAALNGLSFTPTAAYSGPALLTMTSSDLGRSGIGGTMTDVDTVAITVGAAPPPPPPPPSGGGGGGGGSSGSGGSSGGGSSSSSGSSTSGSGGSSTSSQSGTNAIILPADSTEFVFATSDQNAASTDDGHSIDTRFTPSSSVMPRVRLNAEEYAPSRNSPLRAPAMEDEALLFASLVQIDASEQDDLAALLPEDFDAARSRPRPGDRRSASVATGSASASLNVSERASELPLVPPVEIVGGSDTMAAAMASVGMSALTAGLSVGYAWWAWRSVSWLTSLLWSAPAWRSFDPLPLIDFAQRERRVGDESEPDWLAGGSVVAATAGGTK